MRRQGQGSRKNCIVHQLCTLHTRGNVGRQQALDERWISTSRMSTYAVTRQNAHGSATDIFFWAMITYPFYLEGKDYYPWDANFSQDKWKTHIRLIEDGNIESLKALLDVKHCRDFEIQKNNLPPKIFFIAAVENLQIDVAKFLMSSCVLLKTIYHLFDDAVCQLLYHSIVSKRRLPHDDMVPMLEYLVSEAGVRYKWFDRRTIINLETIYKVCIFHFQGGNVTKLLSFLQKFYPLFEIPRLLMSFTELDDLSELMNTILYFRYIRDSETITIPLYSIFNPHSLIKTSAINCDNMSCYNWLTKDSYPNFRCVHYPMKSRYPHDCYSDLEYEKFIALKSIAESKGMVALALEKLCLRHVLFTITGRGGLNLKLCINQIYDDFLEVIKRINVL
jgi:hypothetical protein